MLVAQNAIIVSRNLGQHCPVLSWKVSHANIGTRRTSVRHLSRCRPICQLSRVVEQLLVVISKDEGGGVRGAANYPSNSSSPELDTQH